MEEVYPLHQHEYCAAIYLHESSVDISFRGADTREIRLFNDILPSERDCIIYNKHTQKVSSWGNAAFESQDNEFDIRIDSFMDGLYKLFEKDKKQWNEKDIFFHNAVSDFLSLAMKKVIQSQDINNKSLDSYHYGFIVPSEWEEEIREELIRPIFIQAGLLSKEDHKDRLLFVSDLECICYHHNRAEEFKRGQNTIISRINYIDDDTSLIKLDLVKSTNTLFNFPDSKLFPKVMRSTLFSIKFKNIECSIKSFLKDKLLHDDNNSDNNSDNNYNNNYDKALQKITEWIYGDITSKKFDDDYKKEEDFKNMLMKPIILESICRSHIGAAITKPLIDNIKNLLSNNFTKEYKILTINLDLSRHQKTALAQSMLLKFMFRCSILDLHKIASSKSIMFPDFFTKAHLRAEDAFVPIKEAIQNSEMYSPPRIVPTENLETSPSVFINAKPDAIINIDISFKSTIISHSFLKENGSVKEPFDQNYFTTDKWLPSLEQFYDASNAATLTIDKQFISFADKYLLGDFNFMHTVAKFLSKAEKILYNDYSNETNMTSIHQKKYLEAFFLMYLIYIKHLISNKLPIYTKSNTTALNIGYAISIEKLLLNKIIGDKEDLKQLVYKSGLVNKDDDTTKLRITAQGEGILSIVQLTFKLDFPVKTFFVLSQLYEDYIQLTMNQVVTASSLDDEQQEAIIIEDKFIRIQNIYKSLSQNMWNSLMEDSTLIEFCDTHSKNNHAMAVLFSLESKKEFHRNFKEYIIKNVLNSNSNLKNIGEGIINLNKSCNCKINLKANDIIYVCFKPTLQSIHTVMMSSLINEGMFGKYNYIQYLFTLVHFNNNPHFQKIISTILQEEGYYCNPKRGIETQCMTLPKSQIEHLQPGHKLHSYFYKGFQIGALRQIYNENYRIKIFSGKFLKKLSIVYENKTISAENPRDPFAIYIPILKKEDVFSGTEVNYQLYIKPAEIERDNIEISIESYKSSDILQNDELTPEEINERIKNRAFHDDFRFETEPRDIPVSINLRYLGHLSSIRIIIKEAGGNATKRNTSDFGNPMTLCRS